jgi:hypothetical protein
MLVSSHAVLGCAIRTEERIGAIKDLYFDDREWRIRYALVHTGALLSGRDVLISPFAMGDPDWEANLIPTNLTTEQVQDSPPMDAHKPISRQHEEALARHYGWQAYWMTTGGAGEAIPPPVGFEARSEDVVETNQPDASGLRSIKEVEGYRIHAADGEIGHAEAFILDSARHEWWIRYMVVDTRNWLPGRKVLVAPGWIRSIDWGRREITVDHTREQVEQSPPYDPHKPVNREYEIRLYDYYGRPRYWP